MIQTSNLYSENRKESSPGKQLNNLSSALCTLLSTEKFDAINEVINSCSVFDNIKPRSAFIEAVFRRECLDSTGIGHGVAIAHGKLPSIKKITIGLGISPGGIPFDSVDGKPVHILFVVGSSPDKQDEYLSSLSSLMRFIRNTSVRSYLRNYPAVVHKEINKMYGSFFMMLSTQQFSY